MQANSWRNLPDNLRLQNFLLVLSYNNLQAVQAMLGIVKLHPHLARLHQPAGPGTHRENLAHKDLPRTDMTKDLGIQHMVFRM